MSQIEDGADLPSEVVENIVMKLPLKFATRFRCVCKRWDDLIRSGYRKLITYDEKHVYSLNGDNLIPSDGKVFPYNLGSNHELCVEGHANGIIFASARSNGMCTYVMWNPANGEYKALPNNPPETYLTAHVYFGFNSETKDYNVLMVGSRRPRRVDLYSLKTDSWRVIRTPLVYNFRSESRFWCEPGCVDGAFFWLGVEPNCRQKGVVLFDIGEEEFKFVDIPSSLTDSWDVEPTMYKGSIAIVGQYEWKATVGVWVMKKFGDATSWVPQFSLDVDGYLIKSFLSSGEFIFYHMASKSLVFWCPVSQKSRNFSLPPGAILDNRYFSYTENFVTLRGEPTIV